MKINYSAVERKSAFVYGSLLPGLHNHDLVGDFVTRTRPALISGFDMYANGRHFPFIVPGEGDVRGEILDFDDEDFPLVLRALDNLEGYSDSDYDLYTRTTVTAVTDTGEAVEVYVYVAHPRLGIDVPDEDGRMLPRVPRGNWREWLFPSMAGAPF